MTEAEATDILYRTPYAERVREVKCLQRRSYKAARKGQEKKMMKLQRLLLASDDAKTVAAITIAKVNKGKRSAGVDGVKQPTDRQILEIARSLSIESRPRPVLRTEIPKAGSSKMRTLGMPTIRDRATQMLVLLALSPQLEAEMASREIEVDGFRPGRSTHDAIKALRGSVDKIKGKYVAECDIEKCFDNIDHEALLSKFESWPKMNTYIRRVLKAGAIEGRLRVETNKGVPQGGPLSGLLTNWALLGLEEHITKNRKSTIQADGKALAWKVIIVRYADDIRIVHRDKGIIEECLGQLEEFLGTIGLTLNQEKTRIVNITDGTDFLGFTIRQFSTDPKNKKSGNDFTTIIKPSKQAIKRHGARLKAIIKYHNARTQSELINSLNPVIRGWANYYSTENSKDSFSKVDHLLFGKLVRWAKRRHGNKSWKWIKAKYFNKGAPWIFRAGIGEVALIKHAETKIRPRPKMPRGKSIFDSPSKEKKTHPLALKYEIKHADISEAWASLREEHHSLYPIEELCEPKGLMHSSEDE